MEELLRLKLAIQAQFDWIYEIDVEDNAIIITEDFIPTGDEKNDDDCYDEARETGELIIEKFPRLEIKEYYCHRHKYSIVTLILKQ